MTTPLHLVRGVIKNGYFTVRLTVREGGGGVNPYGQPDCKKTVFYDSPKLYCFFSPKNAKIYNNYSI